MDKVTIAKKFAELKWLGAAHFIEHLEIDQYDSSHQLLTLLNDLAISQQSYFAVNRQQRLKKAAKLRWPDAMINDFSYRCETKAVQESIAKACDDAWVEYHSHKVLTGAAGTGKTTLACAIANKLLMKGYSVRMMRFNDLIFDLATHEKEGTYQSYIQRLCKFNVLVIDDWALFPLNTKQRQMLYELIERREQVGSLIITSQYSFDKWHEAIGEVTIADAVIDRIASMSDVIALRGDPKRKSHRVSGGQRNG
ncbi:ATP-binding protein [Aliiglaciecola sp.]|nr:ATP-binding protein [Aliiglaciecola sp.]